MLEMWFTPASARRALGRVRPAVESLHRLFAELERRRPLAPGSDSPIEPQYWAMVETLVRGLDKLRRSGLLVDDLRQGMLDFPALLEGRPVLLCWRVGEPSLDFWHEPGNGVDRIRVDDEGPWVEPPDSREPLC